MLNLSGWFLVLIASLLYIYDFILRVAPGVLSEQIMPWLNFNPWEWSLISSMFYYGYAIMQVPSGMLVDRYGVRNLFIYAAVISSLCFAVPLITNSFVLLLCSRFLMGMAASLAYVGPLVIARWYLPLSHLALSGGVVQVLGCIGAIAGTWLVMHLYKFFGLVQTFYLIVFLGFFITLLFIVCLPKVSEWSMKSWQDEFVSIKLVSNMKESYILGFIALSLWCPIVIFLETWGMSWLTQVGYSQEHASWIMVLGWICIACGGPIFGVLSLKFSIKKLLLYALIMSSLGSIIWLILPHYLAWFAVVLFSFAASAQCLTFAIVANIHKGRHIGVAVGFNNMAIVASGFTVLPIVGYFINMHSHLNFMYAQCIVVLLVFISLYILTYVKDEE